MHSFPHYLHSLNILLALVMIIDWQRFHAEIRFIGYYRWGEHNTYQGGLYDHMLWVLTDGEGTMHTPNGVYPLHKGRCVWFRPGVHFHITQETPHLTMYSAVFALRDQHGKDRGMDWQLPADTLDEPQKNFAAQIAKRLQDLAGEQETGGRASFSGDNRACANQLLTALLMELDRHNHTDDIHSAPVLNKLQRELYDLVRHISAHPGLAPSPGEQAEKLGITHTHLCRLYRQLFRSSPTQFVMMFRYRHARRLLSETDMSLADIAEEIGYSSQSFFSRQFKQQAQISPQAWRQQYRERNRS